MNDKIMISNWARKWYYLIKKNAPNQLVTYGLDGLGNILTWDPSALTYDFLSMHFYHNDSNPDTAKNAVACYFRWMHDNVDDVWVLGETGFSGTAAGDTCLSNPEVGTDTAQYQYADFTMRRSVGCGCKGYAWWQYQEVNWNSCVSKHLGLVTSYPEQRLKPAASLFPTFSAGWPFVSCNRPNNYYDIPGYEYGNISGMVTDENSNPIQDAVVKAYTQGYHTQYTTFSNNQGQFTVFAPEDSLINHLWVSYKGYSCKKLDFYTPPTDPVVLTHINYNRWKKNWTNINYPKAGDTVLINSTDGVVVGNFCGDEAHELLVVKYSTNMAFLYRFYNDHWKQVWTGSIGNWQISSGDKFYAGDFDGDGYDELLCVQNVTNAWASVFYFESLYSGNPWTCTWTNAGSGQIGNWRYAPSDVILPGHFNDTTYCSLLFIRNSFRPTSSCQRLSFNTWVTVWQSSFYIGPPQAGVESPTRFDKYYVGDFNGDGIDELFCTQVTNGTSDMMKVLKLDTAWSALWSNNGISEGVGIYPYRGNLHVGNFDMDRADELLGVGTWATKFDLNVSNQWGWSWSTYDPGKLSDWAVNPSHRIFFLKTMTDVPDYLFVARGTPRINFEFDGYSYDP